MKNIEGGITVLKTMGIKPNYTELGREYNMDPRTAKKKYLGIENQKRGRKKGSKLDDYQEIIKEKLNIPGTTKQGVYKFLTMNLVSEEEIGGYSNFIKYISKNDDIFTPKDVEPHPRFETARGKQLQFDWKGSIKLHSKNGELVEFYVFSATLCASRLHIFIFSEFMTIENVERCLIEVFRYIGGVPEECLTDNMSSIVNYSEKEFTKEFKAFAKDMGFIPKGKRIFATIT